MQATNRAARKTNLFTTLAELWNYDSRNFFSNKIRIIFRAVLWPLLKRNDYRNAPSESISPQYEGTRPCLLSSVCPSFLIVRLNSSRALGCCFQSFVCFCSRSSTKKASILYLGKDKSALFFCVSGISGLHNHYNNGFFLFKLKYKHLLNSVSKWMSLYKWPLYDHSWPFFATCVFIFHKT